MSTASSRDARQAGGRLVAGCFDDATAPVTGDPVKISGDYQVQVTAAATSPATSAVVVVERSTRDPAGSTGPNWAAVDTLSSLGAVQSYYEAGAAWIRYRATTLNGGAHLSLMGGTWS